MHQVVVLGGGAGGITAARNLARLWEGAYQITLVTDQERYTYCPALPMLMIGKRTPREIQNGYANLKSDGTNVRFSKATGIDARNGEVKLEDDALDYHALLCAMGMTYQPDNVPGFSNFACNAYSLEGAEEIHKKLAAMTSGEIVIFISSLPIKCPGAPYEMAFLIHQFLSEKKRRENIGITIVTPEPTPESAAPPPVGKSFRDAIAEAEITLLTESKVLSLEKGKLNLDHGQSVPGDLLIGVLSQRGPLISLDNPDIADGAGFFIVDPDTLGNARSRRVRHRRQRRAAVPDHRVLCAQDGVVRIQAGGCRGGEHRRVPSKAKAKGNV